MTLPVLELQNVCKSYALYHQMHAGLKSLLVARLGSRPGRRTPRRFTALKNVSFQLQEGECLGIIGRNGAGKSTVLGLCAGVLRPDSGSVSVRRRPCPMLELGAGFHPDLTGGENAVLNGMLLGASRSFMRSRTSAIFDFAEIGEHENEPVRTYSSGMLARLGFAVLVHIEPQLLLVDEVLAVGDFAFQAKCYEKINELRTLGVSMVLVTHNMNEIRSRCDRALWIDGHEIRMSGEPDTVVSAYEGDKPAPSMEAPSGPAARVPSP